MGRATFKGNEAKSKMKHPSDIARRGLNTGAIDLRPTALPVRAWRRPVMLLWNMLPSINIRGILDETIGISSSQAMSFRHNRLSDCTVV